MANVNKRIFDTDNALKGSFNGWWGRWQVLTYSIFVFGYAIIIGWIHRLLDYTVMQPREITCNFDNLTNVSNANRSIIQRLSGKSKYVLHVLANSTTDFKFKYSSELGNTVLTDYDMLCDMANYKIGPRYTHFLGYVLGCLLLGFGSDRGGRKMIILGCMWTTGVMSLFQLVGKDFISFTFFQFFIGLFIGGVQASFLPAIIEMFPINFRAFYGTLFHLIICLFEIVLPWLSMSFKSWITLQIFVTAPIVITATLQWLVFESIFWYLAYKEYDKAIKVLTELAKRNGISFETKFKEAKDFLRAKHSKATQVDILPLLRLQDIELLGKKYPQVDMAELQKQKANSSKLRYYLNQLKGESYRSTNTIYRPLDFIYSPTLLVYVLILSGLWMTNGLTESMEGIRPNLGLGYFADSSLASLTCFSASLLAVFLSFFKIGRRWMIFLAYIVIEICVLGSSIAENTRNEKEDQAALSFLYYTCKFATYFGFIFLMLITAELFPTSLRCTGMGICFSLRMLGIFISSPNYLNYNSSTYRLAYCLFTLFFGSITLLLPETKSFPLPRSILQIEAMPTAIGKKLRSRKVKMACERRQNELSENQPSNTKCINASKPFTNVPPTIRFNKTESANSSDYIQLNEMNRNLLDDSHELGQTRNVYDTVSSAHDIEQDDHRYYYDKVNNSQHPLIPEERKLAKIVEVPSKNITRNNSISDLSQTSSKV